MLLYIYPKCSTCKKALKFLEDRNIECEIRNINEKPPTLKEFNEYNTIGKKEIKKYFNTSGILYKELNLKDKLLNMSDEEKIKTLISDGMLIKRPLLIGDNFVINGFKEKEWEDIFN